MGLADWFVEIAQAIPPPVAVFLLAMSPVWEVRMSIPVGVLLLDMSWPWALGISFIGNLAVIPILHIFFPWLEGRMRKWGRAEKALDKYIDRMREKRGPKIERLREAAVFGLIAIPVPGTGLWTGAFVAHVFGLPLRKTWPFYLAGVAVACILTTALVMGGVWTFNRL